MFFYASPNFKTCDAPLKIVRFYPNFLWNFLILSETKLGGEKNRFKNFLFQRPL